jgi:hypothetical protein
LLFGRILPQECIGDEARLHDNAMLPAAELRALARVVDPATVYATMSAIGMVDDRLLGCRRRGVRGRVTADCGTGGTPLHMSLGHGP